MDLSDSRECARTSTVALSGKRSARKPAWVLFVGLVAIYHANDGIVEEGDAVANLGLPIALLEHGTLAFSRTNNPEMFNWRSLPPMTPRDDLYVRTWKWVVDKDFAYHWRDKGKIQFNGVRYFAVKAPARGLYVSTFGPIPGFTLIPLVQVMLWIDSNFPHKVPLKWSAAKLQASAMVAASAVFLFLLALRISGRRPALVLAWAYGLGTCVWTTSSQTMWQQTVNMFFLMLGAYLLICRPKTTLTSVLSGLAFGTAVACRHTSLLVLAPVGVYLLMRDRQRVIPFGLGTTPLPMVVAIYNTYFFGRPWSFAQEVVGHEIAMEKTGSPDLWQTPLLDGLAGLLFSPSRGLAIFSPFLLLSVWGVVRIWRRSELSWLRPLSIGALAIMLLQCKWFDWWGGWSYGYRPWLDAVPFLSLFVAPVLDTIASRWFLRWAFGVTVGWSIAVQALGAWAYDKSWNERTIFLVQQPDGSTKRAYDDYYEAEALAQRTGGKIVKRYQCNVDVLRCRYRLWSLEDNILTYYVKNGQEARQRRWRSGWTLLRY